MGKVVSPENTNNVTERDKVKHSSIINEITFHDSTVTFRPSRKMCLKFESMK